MHVGMSGIAVERNDLTAAAEHLRRAEELGEHAWLPQNPYRWRVASAPLREAHGDLDGALELLDEAERVYVGDFSPNVRPVPAMIARVLAAQGRVGEALAWAREQGLAADDELSYLREFEHITLARVLLASRGAAGRRPAPRPAARGGRRRRADRQRHRDPGAAGAGAAAATRRGRPRTGADPGRAAGLRPGLRRRRAGPAAPARATTVRATLPARAAPARGGASPAPDRRSSSIR